MSQRVAANEGPATLHNGFLAYLTIQVANGKASPDITTLPHARWYDGFIARKSNCRKEKLHRTKYGYIFHGDSFSNRENVRAAIQFRGERQR